jgi:uncharacterized protein UPF0158
MTPAASAVVNACEVKVVTLKYEDLSLAFAFVCSAAPMEHFAYISLDSGAIYWISELNPLEEEVPADLETSERCLEIPHKNDLDLGKNLALDFVAEKLPDQYAEVEGFFQRRGAYARFKDFLARKGRPDDWYAFEAESTDRALKNWCAEHDIQVIET